MRLIATILLVGALGLVGCGDKGSGADGGDGAAETKTTSGGAGTKGAGEGSKPGDDSVAETVRREGAAAAADPSEFDRSTAEGTIGLFVTHMQRGEFEDAVVLADPESVGYGEMAETVTVLAEAAAKPEAQGVSFEALMRAFFSRGWHGAVWQPVSVQDERARFEIKLVDADPRTVDLRRTDGEWYVMVPEWAPRVKGDVDDLMPTDLPAGGGAGG